VDKYITKPVIRSLLQLVPGWCVADTLLQHRADEIRTDRLRAFLDELADGRVELTDDLIHTEDFLHCYFCTLRAVVNTRQREKIRLFARLLDSSLTPAIGTTTDEFEELLTVLDIITLREFAVLCGLREHEVQNPKKAGENELQNAWQYWDKFKNDSTQKFSIPENAFKAFMAKLERTGLYLRITGGFMDYQGDVGRTTPLFARLLEFVGNSETQQSTVGED
jgi:hypothetical protein